MPITADDLKWNNVKIQLPVGQHLVETELISQLESHEVDSLKKFTAAKQLTWLRRTEKGHQINMSTLNINNVWLLNLPDETFVEYQLATQQMLPGSQVCTAAYIEYRPGYVCTEIAYSQGGYESSQKASTVGPRSKAILIKTIREILGTRE